MVSNVIAKSGALYASIAVPKPLRVILGRSTFQKKLLASTKPKAALEAQQYITKWKLQIKLAKAALAHSGDALLDRDTSEALSLQRLLAAETSSTSKESFDSFLWSLADQLEDKHSYPKAKELYDISTGAVTLLAAYFDGWSASLANHSPRIRDAYRSEVQAFIKHFKTVQEVSRPAVRAYFANMIAKGRAVSTVKQIAGFAVNHFFKYLDARGVLDPDKPDPFFRAIPSEPKPKGSKGWLPLLPQEVSHIYQAIPSEDHQLRLLVNVARYTGMRIEEVCSLKAEQVRSINGVLCLDIQRSKTSKGVRVVPVATRLTQAVTDAVAGSSDGYLVSGLTISKYGDRSNAVGKRFSSLKQALGFSSRQVFHSIRKCVVTQLEQAGVPESVVADLVGHEKQTITFGLYSGGSSMGSIFEAVEKLEYP